MRPANLFARSLLFYERTDMSSGAQRAGATNGRARRSTKCGAGGSERWKNSVYVEKIRRRRVKRMQYALEILDHMERMDCMEYMDQVVGNILVIFSRCF